MKLIHKIKRLTLVIAGGAILSGLPGGVIFAQTNSAGAVFATRPEVTPPTVSEIKYVFDGQRKIDETVAAAHVRLRIGEPYSQASADSSIRALYATGFFEFVSIEPERRANDTVSVSILLIPRYRVEKIAFEGNNEWAASSFFGSGLLNECEIKEGDPLDEVLVKRTVEKIAKKYDKRFPFAEITPRINRDEKNGTATITFVIKEGVNTKINDIEFSGNTAISSFKLSQRLDTTTWAWTFDPTEFPSWRFVKFSPISALGRYHEEEFHRDLQKLREFYRDQGFLDVEIPNETAKVEYVEKDNINGRLKISIAISEGPRYEVGAISIEGNALGEAPDSLFTSDYILQYLAQRRRKASEVYPVGNWVFDQLFNGGVRASDRSEIRTDFDSLATGDWYSPQAVTGAIEKIRDYYGQVGYLDCNVQVIRKPNLDTEKIDLIFRVNEGEKYYLNTINISGNTRTRNRVIIRELAMEPGEVFSTVRMKTSEARLRNTRYFDQRITLSPEPTNIPGRKNLRIEVSEGDTASLTLGVGLSTLEQIFGFIEYYESNFDLFNSRNNFRGGGQKFRLRLQIGTVSSSIVQSFEEPALFDRDLAVGYEAYMMSNGYESSDYELQRTGVNLYANRRVIENIYARLSYSLEDVRLRRVAWNVPQFIRDEEGSRVISKIGLTFSRDTRNDVFFPTFGNRFELSQQVAGGPLGGNVDYYQIEARAAQWIPIFDECEQTLRLLGRIGAMTNFNGTAIPFYEKFHLGGPDTMRGFKYQYVGPFESNEPCGGLSYVFLSAEYTIRMFDQLRFALFYDWGFVNAEKFDFNTSGYNDNLGFGFRILVMGAILRLDFGFPIATSPDNDFGMRFNFAFGTVF